jgi:hypothetical protein
LRIHQVAPNSSKLQPFCLTLSVSVKGVSSSFCVESSFFHDPPKVKDYQL